jgi:hypothetical protein
MAHLFRFPAASNDLARNSLLDNSRNRIAAEYPRRRACDRGPQDVTIYAFLRRYFIGVFLKGRNVADRATISQAGRELNGVGLDVAGAASAMMLLHEVLIDVDAEARAFIGGHRSVRLDTDLGSISTSRSGL